jgi:hypothetical protein
MTSFLSVRHTYFAILTVVNDIFRYDGRTMAHDSLTD